ncbi:MAG: hypothetical protein BWY66_01278 [bacterium ADurb.Bin374]|nr:MAG: hypothetical protein BWY66_01278 [bacterium ADurb.Bin374]
MNDRMAVRRRARSCETGRGDAMAVTTPMRSRSNIHSVPFCSTTSFFSAFAFPQAMRNDRAERLRGGAQKSMSGMPLPVFRKIA